MKKILVPTDFSDCALKALTYASEMASRTGSLICLLHVVTPMAENMSQPLATDQKYTEELNESRLQKLDEIKSATLDVYPKVTLQTELARGSIVAAVNDLVDSGSFDLIVMGTTGASGLKQIFMGSVAAGMIDQAKIPVLTVPAAYSIEEPDNIVFATNRFEENDDILSRIFQIASLFNAHLHVVVFADKDDAEDYIRKTRDLDRYKDFLKRKFPDIPVKTRLLEGDDFERELEKYEAGNEVDILVMVSYPKSILEKMLSRSVTQRMAFHSTIPIFAIPGGVTAFE